MSVEEILHAENYIIKEMQKKEFKEEYLLLAIKKQLSTHSKLLGLRSKLDSKGMLRSDGQLTYAQFIPYNVRHPIILPQKIWVTKLIVKHYLEFRELYCWPNQILASLTTRFWIIAPREVILKWEKEYVICRRRKAKVAQQIMALLATFE